MLKTYLLKHALNLCSIKRRENFLRLVLASVGIGETNLKREVLAFVELLDTSSGSPLILDFGANSGEWSKEFFAIVPSAILHLFEPGKSHQDFLRGISSAAPKHFIIHQYGVSGDGRECVLYAPSPGSGAASILEGDNLDFGFSEVIQTKTIAEILGEYPDCIGIKFDIEGAELEVLNAGYDAIKNSQVKVIEFEFGEKTASLRQNFRMFFDVFNSMNFDLFRSTPTGLYKLTEYSRFTELHINTVYFASRKSQ